MSQLSDCSVVASQLMPSWNCLHAIHLHPTQLQPIHEILRRSNLGDMETKRQNLKRALDDYLLEFHACRCGPCQNNGEPVLVGDTCFCQCRPGYGGAACEQMKRRGKTPACTCSRGGWKRQQRDRVFLSTWLTNSFLHPRVNQAFASVSVLLRRYPKQPYKRLKLAARVITVKKVVEMRMCLIAGDLLTL